MATSKLNPELTQPQQASVLKRLGWVSFLFFFAKGMLWLLVPWVAVHFW